MMNGKPLLIDGFCGLGGASEGFLAEGWECVGFDNERHDYGTGGYPGQLVLQDIRTIHGSQLRDADFLWFSPPCQEFSYMAMPWSRGKQIAKALRGDGKFPDGYRGSRTLPELKELFYTCWRIQIEACHAADRYIPMVIENVRGAQPWVGKATYQYGSFSLWGDIPALMPEPVGRKNSGGSWFNVAHNTTSGVGKNPVHELCGQKLPGNNSERNWSNRRVQRLRDAQSHPFYNSSSSSVERKAASALIAKIPVALTRHLARVYDPRV